MFKVNRNIGIGVYKFGKKVKLLSWFEKYNYIIFNICKCIYCYNGNKVREKKLK